MFLVGGDSRVARCSTTVSVVIRGMSAGLKGRNIIAQGERSGALG
jgi:hypothetical protein